MQIYIHSQKGIKTPRWFTITLAGNNIYYAVVKERYFSTTVTVYDQLCIFCNNNSKRMKGKHPRETMVHAVELRADKTIHDIATMKRDERLLAITSRDIVVPKAHYPVINYILVYLRS